LLFFLSERDSPKLSSRAYTAAAEATKKERIMHPSSGGEMTPSQVAGHPFQQLPIQDKGPLGSHDGGSWRFFQCAKRAPAASTSQGSRRPNIATAPSRNEQTRKILSCQESARTYKFGRCDANCRRRSPPNTGCNEKNSLSFTHSQALELLGEI